MILVTRLIAQAKLPGSFHHTFLEVIHDERRAAQGTSYLFVYSPLGYVIKLRMGQITGTRVTAWWFDPRTGDSTRIASFPNSGFKEFDPPGEPGRGNDWVLAVDDEEMGYPAPGSVDLRYR
ncbi:MAG: putative collagen-binding domain-containing protein [Opitutaceae bacterium]